MLLKKQITKDEINELPLWRYEGEIVLIEEPKSLGSVMKYLRQFDFVGFDTEAKPAFQKGQYNPVCLMQFATPEKVVLVRNRLTGFSDMMVDLFEDERIKKVGAGIKDDIKDLQYWRPFSPAGFVDLNSVVKELGFVNSGVKNLAALFLEKRISKNQQTTNWERDQLSIHQQLYAATDAWVCYEVYRMLDEKGWLSTL
jgi:ribonuclease D